MIKNLKTGSYFGSHYQKSVFGGLIITDTEYTHTKVDWHRHENPYFTYLLQGKLFEASKKGEQYLTSGGLLFHNWQDSHYNIKPDEFTRGFHVELNSNWFSQHDLPLDCIEGSHCVENPLIKSFMNLVFKECKINDAHSQLSIDGLMLNAFNQLAVEVKAKRYKRPLWLKTLKEYLSDSYEKFSLTELSHLLNIHPVHLSREFHRYFGVTFGQYIRYVRVNKAFGLLVSRKLSMTEVCFECGFYDQSHFIRDFKRIYGDTPKKLNNLIQTNSQHP